jgi:hypothetical protein
MTSMRRAVVLAVGILISGLLLWIAGRGTRLDEIWAALQGADLAMAVPFTVCLLAFYVIRTYRWTVLLRPITTVRVRDLFGPVMVGYGTNFVLPFQLGEVARTMLARDKANLPFMPIAFSIIVERLFDFMAVLAALALALSMHDSLPGYLSNLGVIAEALVVTLAALMLLAALRTEMVLAAIGRTTAFLPRRLAEPFLDHLRVGFEGLRSLRDKRVLLLSAVTTLVQWVLIGICIWISLLAVDQTVPAQTVLLILALIVLGSSLPTAPGYLGSFQAGYVLGLEAIGGEAAQGMAASIFYHVIYAATAVLLGLFALRQSRLGWKALSGAEARAAE